MRYAAARDGQQGALPHVGAEEGGRDVRVLEGEEGGGEGVQGRALGRLLGRCGREAEDGGRGCGEVDELRECGGVCLAVALLG